MTRDPADTTGNARDDESGESRPGERWAADLEGRESRPLFSLESPAVPPQEDEPGSQPGARWASDAEGPPGGRVFSLEGRRAPGLYLVAWILSIAGAAIVFVGALSTSEDAGLILATVGFSVMTVGLAAGAGSQILDRRDRHPERYRGPAPLLLFCAYFVGLAAIGVLVVGSGIFDIDEPFGFLATALLQSLGYVLVVWLFAVRSGSLTWPQMGWPTWFGQDPRVALRAIGVAMLAVVPATFAILVFGGVIALVLDVEAPQVLPTGPQTPAEAVAVALSAVLIIPIGEEAFFRGFALTAWMRDLGARSALIRSSLFFALIHIVNVSAEGFAAGLGQAVVIVSVILPLALLLGWLYIRHGLLAAIGGHVTYNSLLLFLQYVSEGMPQPT